MSDKQKSTTRLTAKNVQAALRASLHADLEPGGDPPADAVKVEGVVSSYAFHPGQLELQRELVRGFLSQLPEQFREDAGGGWSFLSACEDRSGNLWGQHSDIEALLCMAIGLGLADYVAPREIWSIFPGGMPYFVVLSEVTGDE